MKYIRKISLAISILFCLFFITTIIVNIVIYNNYKVHKTCRNLSSFDVKNYANISNINTIKMLDKCDKIVLFIEVDNEINSENINGIILQIVQRKKVFNDDDIVELVIKNEYLDCLVIIDKNEIIDIDSSKK